MHEVQKRTEDDRADEEMYYWVYNLDAKRTQRSQTARVHNCMDVFSRAHNLDASVDPSAMGRGPRVAHAWARSPGQPSREGCAEESLAWVSSFRADLVLISTISSSSEDTLTMSTLCIFWALSNGPGGFGKWAIP